MIRTATFRRLALAAQLVLLPLATISITTTAAHATVNCGDALSRSMPHRPARADTGSDVMARLMDLGGANRDAAVVAELLAGNMPSHLRHLTPVAFNGTLPDGQDVQVVICVTPDYLAVGSDADNVRVPMGLPAAALIADRFGFLLPTTRMVDAIYAAAEVRLAPSPMDPTNQMVTTQYLLRHSATVDAMRSRVARSPDALTAGQKKDLVLSLRLASHRGMVAIYGWHRTNGRPIQPLSTVHVEQYADYSHGIRLVSQTAFVNGQRQPLSQILSNPQLASLVSSEGPMDALGLQASLH